MTAATAPPQPPAGLTTLPRLAAELGKTVSQLDYLCLKHRIDPAGLVGRTHAYDQAAADAIRKAVAQGR